jgi:hypothetical protein
MFFQVIEFFKAIFSYLLVFKRDIECLFLGLFVDRKAKIFKQENISVPKLFLRNLKKNPNKACIIFEDKTWTFQDVNLSI